MKTVNKTNRNMLCVCISWPLFKQTARREVEIDSWIDRERE
jgi:hypothetical protein